MVNLVQCLSIQELIKKGAGWEELTDNIKEGREWGWAWGFKYRFNDRQIKI